MATPALVPSRTLQASALSFIGLSVGHTLGGMQWTADPAYTIISNTQPWAMGIVGWYQGSAFFFTTGLLHYQWSQNPALLRTPTNKAIALITNAMLWASSAWYLRHGIKENAVAVGLGAVLQGVAVFRALC
ncbi:uncharacterized protein BO97DRAFT_408665 [Aspergillus homomorphus CBS 101889]|uniref:Integral membrane protein n=1 Tax=Aspergillus homomorphus (strain CBS 101889) TaxID=1450537 RepID=A0A395HL15_ASPHC|nr:hypothetical protein BO97DRAFT_408665 [Aspergillus homomorphus CBS 101889]RAL07915.1 hypothetical protein BO97DRAFT_408665 [Aspergillus homomorphus CBS 101889]